MAATRGEIIPSDYDDIVETLRKVQDDGQRVVMSDLGADSASHRTRARHRGVHEVK